MKLVEIRFKGEKIEAEPALTPWKRAKGFSFRNNGKMLFRFPVESRPFIDMMLVQHPLHLYFLDSSKEVVDVQSAEAWTLDPRTWKVYRPGEPAKYLLESFEALDLERGNSLEFTF